MMTRIFWDTIFLISGTFSMSVVLNGSLFTFGAGPSNSTIIETSISIDTNSTDAPNSSSPATTSSRSATTTTIAPTTTTTISPVKSFLFTFGAGPSLMPSIDTNSTGASNVSTSSSTTTSSRSTTTTTTTTTTIHPVKKFVAAAVRSHFDDCPDSHRHFCFHGTCRFLILEETPACVCHAGFIGMRCEHADLLAVVATNHRQHTLATLLVLCVIGCVLIMLLCTLLHCWWRQDCRRRNHRHHYIPEKHGASCHPSESVPRPFDPNGDVTLKKQWFEKTSCWKNSSGLHPKRYTCSDQAALANGKETLWSTNLGLWTKSTVGTYLLHSVILWKRTQNSWSEALRMKLPPNPPQEERCVS